MKRPQTHFSSLLIYLSFIIIVLHTLIGRILYSWYTPLWQDETLMLYVANHKPFSPYFYVALRDLIAAMPWSFVEYWAYLKLLKASLPLNSIMEHVELILRLPLTLYSIIFITSVFIISRRLSRSNLFATFITVLLVTINYMSSHLGTELRFHTSGFAHSALSWCLLTLLLTSEHKSKLASHILLMCWSISVLIAGAAHIYSTYSLFIQVFVFVLTNHHCIPSLSLEKLNDLFKSACLLLVYGVGIIEGLFLRFVMTKPALRTEITSNTSEAISLSLQSLSKYLFIPNIWLWVGLFLFCIGYTIIQNKNRNDRLKLLIVAGLGLAQLALMLLLSVKYFKWSWGPETWIGRYAMAGLLPFIFFLSYFARDVIKKNWEMKWGGYVCLAGLMLYLIFPPTSLTYWRKPQLKESYKKDQWTKIRKEILTHDAYGKVTHVLGIEPNFTHFNQQDINGNMIDQTWQLYTGGPFSIAKVGHRNPFGGREGVQCKNREKLPLIFMRVSSYAIDFCEEGKTVLRMVKP